MATSRKVIGLWLTWIAIAAIVVGAICGIVWACTGKHSIITLIVLLIITVLSIRYIVKALRSGKASTSGKTFNASTYNNKWKLASLAFIFLWIAIFVGWFFWWLFAQPNIQNAEFTGRVYNNKTGKWDIIEQKPPKPSSKSVTTGNKLYYHIDIKTVAVEPGKYLALSIMDGDSIHYEATPDCYIKKANTEAQMLGMGWSPYHRGDYTYSRDIGVYAFKAMDSTKKLFVKYSYFAAADENHISEEVH
jgi:hypothetical protein